MSEIVTIARKVLAKRDLDGSQFCDEHDETCAYIHPHCLIEGLVAEIARLREELTIYVHAHETGNSVPPHIEEQAKSLAADAKVKEVG